MEDTEFIAAVEKLYQHATQARDGNADAHPEFAFEYPPRAAVWNHIAAHLSEIKEAMEIMPEA